jgi:ketosteroid isomerase-like protein
MVDNTNAQIRHVFDEWHRTIRDRDIDGLVALYAEDAIFESPAVAALNGGADGMLRGRSEIRSYFEKNFFAKMDKTVIEWFRTGKYFTDGTILEWEYPRQSPKGNQNDIVESMDLKDGLIKHHRVYWGWVGMKNILDAAKK